MIACYRPIIFHYEYQEPTVLGCMSMVQPRDHRSAALTSEVHATSLSSDLQDYWQQLRLRVTCRCEVFVLVLALSPPSLPSPKVAYKGSPI